MTGNVRDNCYLHIRLLPTHPHLASTDFIRLSPVATSADPLITHSPYITQNRWLVRKNPQKVKFYNGAGLLD